jgi:hypothetical protein
MKTWIFMISNDLPNSSLLTLLILPVPYHPSNVLALPNIDLIAPAPALQLTVAALSPLIHQQLSDSNTSIVSPRSVLPGKSLGTKVLATMAP